MDPYCIRKARPGNPASIVECYALLGASDTKEKEALHGYTDNKVKSGSFSFLSCKSFLMVAFIILG